MVNRARRIALATALIASQLASGGTIAAAIGSPAVPIGTRSASDEDIDSAIAEAARRFALPPAWIRAVIRAESAGVAFDRDGRPLVSSAGAIGLMQLMPATYAEMARLHGLGADPSVPRDNILAGSAFLRQMYDRFGSPGFLAAYNAGPRRWQDHVATGTPLPRETIRYMAIIGQRLGLPVTESAVISTDRPGETALREPEPDTLFPATRREASPGGGGLFFALRPATVDAERHAVDAPGGEAAADRLTTNRSEN